MPTFFTLLKDSWQYAKLNYRLIASVVIRKALIPALGFAILIAALALTKAYIPLVIAIVVAFIILVPIFCGVTGGVIEIALSAVEDRETRFTYGKAGSILGVSLLLALGEIIITLPFSALHLQFISTLINLILGAWFYLLIVVLVAEDAGVGSFKRTWELMRGYKGYVSKIYFSLIGLIILVLAVPMIALVVYALSSREVGAPPTYLSWPFIAFAVCFGIAGLLYGLFVDPFLRVLVYDTIRHDQSKVGDLPSDDTTTFDFNAASKPT